MSTIPTSYVVATNNYSPVAIKYLREQLQKANIPVITTKITEEDEYRSMRTTAYKTLKDAKVLLGTSPMALYNPYAQESARDLMSDLGIANMASNITTDSVSILSVIHGLSKEVPQLINYV